MADWIVAISGCRDGVVTADGLDMVLPNFIGRTVEVRVGDCPTGIDACVRGWGQITGRPVKVFKADWEAHGKAAGPIRNREMVQGVHLLIAFWDGTSRGTLSAIREATKAGAAVRIYPLPLAPGVLD